MDHRYDHAGLVIHAKFNFQYLDNPLPIHGSFVLPAVGRAGRLWVMWSDDIDIDIAYSSENPHHRKSKDILESRQCFYLIFLGKPIYCMRDFNDILSPLIGMLNQIFIVWSALIIMLNDVV